MLPVAQHESVLDYRVLEERPNKAGEPSRRILLVVAPRDQVEPYTQVAAGRRAQARRRSTSRRSACSVRSSSRSRSRCARVDDTATVVVSIGHESTTLLVAGGGVCEFTRVFDWGGGTLQDAIAQELDVHHRRGGDDPSSPLALRPRPAARDARRGRTREGDRGRAAAAHPVRARARQLAPVLPDPARLARHRRDRDHRRHLAPRGPRRGAAPDDRRQRPRRRSARRASPSAPGSTRLSRRRSARSRCPSGSRSRTTACAASTCCRRTSARPRRKRPSLVAVALPVAIAVPVAALGFMFVSAHGQVGDSQSQLDAIRAEIDALPTPTRPVIDASLQGQQAAAGRRPSPTCSAAGLPGMPCSRDVSRVLPENVWLTSLQAQVAATAAIGTTAVATAAPATPGVPTTPTGVLIDGYTYSLPDVARLLARLATLPSAHQRDPHVEQGRGEGEDADRPLPDRCRPRTPEVPDERPVAAEEGGGRPRRRRSSRPRSQPRGSSSSRRSSRRRTTSTARWSRRRASSPSARSRSPIRRRRSRSRPVTPTGSRRRCRTPPTWPA